MTRQLTTPPGTAWGSGAGVHRIRCLGSAGVSASPVSVASPVVRSCHYYQQVCGFPVVVYLEEQRIVLRIGAIGAVTVPTALLPASAAPVICHPGGRRCSILTLGVPHFRQTDREQLLQWGIAIADPGSGVVLPMCDNDPDYGWLWIPRPPTERTMLEPPLRVLDELSYRIRRRKINPRKGNDHARQ